MKKGISLVLCAVLLLMCMPLSALAQDTTLTFADTICWNAEYDVVVVGFGGAGGVSAIAASEEGASVLITEKAPRGHEGGNTKYSHQAFLGYSDYDLGVQFVSACSEGFDNMTEDVVDLIVRGSMELSDWMVSVGMPSVEFANPGHEYPDMPGVEGVLFGNVIGETSNPVKPYWGGICDAIDARQDKIDVWYESPARHLIQDPFSKTILGVQIERQGEMVNVRAKNGVVLATGGFENNDAMVETYLNRREVFPNGSVYNTGDGITMAQEVGAELWHMGAISGSFMTVAIDGSEQAYFNNMLQNILKDDSAIVVGGDGTRFADETGSSRHGHMPFAGTYMPQPLPAEMYAIFDETGRQNGHTIGIFSEDLSAEIASGRVIKADTIEELAEKLGMTGGYYDSVDSFVAKIFTRDFHDSGLVETVARYNSYCEAGYDPECNHNPASLRKIETAPFYAVKLVASMVNTQGGPKRNVECEVLDTQGNAIPHLYSAGELGSFYGGYYTAGGNLSETVFTGRIAGKNAAQPKEALPTVSLTRVDSALTDYGTDWNQGDMQVDIKAGQYVGTGKGINGDIVVRVTIVDGHIQNVEVISENETEGIGKAAYPALYTAVCSSNSTNVDVVAGATITSQGYLAAVDEALAAYEADK